MGHLFTSPAYSLKRLKTRKGPEIKTIPKSPTCRHGCKRETLTSDGYLYIWCLWPHSAIFLMMFILFCGWIFHKTNLQVKKDVMAIHGSHTLTRYLRKPSSTTTFPLVINITIMLICRLLWLTGSLFECPEGLSLA